MGCCISKPPTRQPPKPSDSPPRLLSPLYHADPSPPRPGSHPTIPSPIPPEEEAVKEIVLSEIPRPPPPGPALLPPAKEDDSPRVASMPQPLASSPGPKPAPQVFCQLPTPRKLDAAETDVLISKLEEAAGVMSEYSNMYTLSGSLTASTTPTTGTAATLNDSEVTSKASRQAARTPSNRVSRRRPLVTGRDERPDRGVGSQARRLHQPSPDRGRRVAPQGSRDAGGIRRNAGQEGRDSRRRSSSPAQGRAGDGIRGGTGKSPVKRTVSAGNRSSSSGPGPGLENGSNTQRCKRREDVDRNDDVRGWKEDGNDDAASESLDNPHVSLECFIFL
ncbi:hypothetical protein MLD38_015800 [Melastoma candidum]|uniref:Uncharacterized protein n=1 Tax=Melastoma candidum TaxID=119954 RepID=A0ACB9RHX5_9MYRT|nr:hypothetical protein MLD38_015800 [Melastoma candidum]